MKNELPQERYLEFIILNLDRRMAKLKPLVEIFPECWNDPVWCKNIHEYKDLVGRKQAAQHALKVAQDADTPQ